MNKLLSFKSVFLVIMSSLLFVVEPCVDAANSYHISASEKPSFIWFRVAKVGTRSIYQAFANNNVSFTVDDSFVPFHPKNSEHSFKFAFVRNPWARVVSCYIDKVQSRNHRAFRECFDHDFEYFVDFINRSDLKNADRHIQVQTTLIPLDDVNFIGRMENFTKDLQHVMEALGLTHLEVPHKHTTAHEHYSYYYTERTKAIIAKKYASDIKTFGYTFENKSKK